MSLIRLKLDGSNIVSESAAKEPGYKTAKISGKTELVIPSSKRAALTEVAGKIKSAIAFGKGYVKYKTLTDKAVAKAKNPKTKSFEKADARQDAKEARALAANNRKHAKLDLKAANAAARKHGLGGLTFSVNAETVFDPKVLKTAKSTEFSVAGKRGVFKPKFVPNEKFMLIGLTKAAMKANADAAKKKPSHAESVRRGVKRTEEKIAAKRKGAEKEASKKVTAGEATFDKVTKDPTQIRKLTDSQLKGALKYADEKHAAEYKANLGVIKGDRARYRAESESKDELSREAGRRGIHTKGSRGEFYAKKFAETRENHLDEVTKNPKRIKYLNHDDLTGMVKHHDEKGKAADPKHKAARDAAKAELKSRDAFSKSIGKK